MIHNSFCLVSLFVLLDAFPPVVWLWSPVSGSSGCVCFGLIFGVFRCVLWGCFLAKLNVFLHGCSASCLGRLGYSWAHSPHVYSLSVVLTLSLWGVVFRDGAGCGFLISATVGDRVRSHRWRCYCWAVYQTGFALLHARLWEVLNVSKKFSKFCGVGLSWVEYIVHSVGRETCFRPRFIWSALLKSQGSRRTIFGLSIGWAAFCVWY